MLQLASILAFLISNVESNKRTLQNLTKMRPLKINQLPLGPKKRKGPLHLRFVQFFHKYEKFHVPLGFILFISGFILGEFVHGLEYIVWAITAFYFACWLYARIEANRDNSVGGLSIKGHFTKIPDYNKQFNARYRTYPIFALRLVSDTNVEEDLMHFVSLSESSPAIVIAHPELSTENRLRLYRTWYSLNADSFLLLEKYSGEHTREVIGGSIILPMTVTGIYDLWNANTSVLNLRTQDIAACGQSISHILIDTWIIDKNHRSRTSGYNYALTLKHISQFWDPTSQDKITILAEPDNNNVTKLLISFGFDGPRKTRSNSQLYYLDFPPHEPLSVEMRQTYSSFLARMAECRSWPYIDAQDD